MKILILGGTVFLGRAILEAALARGHEPTLFNRGKQNADLFPNVEKLRGDRDGGLSALAGRRWDACIDPSGYFPRLVRASAELDLVEAVRFVGRSPRWGSPHPARSRLPGLELDTDSLPAPDRQPGGDHPERFAPAGAPFHPGDHPWRKLKDGTHLSLRQPA